MYIPPSPPHPHPPVPPYPPPRPLQHPGLVIQVDDGNLKVRVSEVVSSTCVKGQALNNHTVHEMSLVHVPHAYR
jgi:hypothetical protein